MSTDADAKRPVGRPSLGSERMKMVNFVAPQGLLDDIDAAAEKEGKKRSPLLRELVRLGLRHKRKSS